MRKKYVLLKDTPELKAGAIVEERCDDGDQAYTCINFAKFGNYPNDEGGIEYSRDVVMKQPEWFEEVTIWYLTKQQVSKLFGRQTVAKKAKRGRPRRNA